MRVGTRLSGVVRRTRLAFFSAFIFALEVGWPLPLYAQDDAPANRVIERLQQCRPAIGTFTRTPRPDLDFAVIDAQYGGFDIDTIRQAVVAMRSTTGAPGVAPIVRIPYEARDAPQAVVKQCLDAGASGVMFPDIETKSRR